MSCTPPLRTVTIARRVTCFSKGGASQGASDIHVLSDDDIAQIAPLLVGLRVTITVENATASCETKAVFQSSSDGCDWGSSNNLEAAFVAGNRSPLTTAWELDQSKFKRAIRLGVLVQQTTGTAVESCKVTMVADFQLRS